MNRYSIIIPTYNRCYSIGRTILSLLAQTYADFEILVIDGNSTDDTVKLIHSINDSRIKYFLNKNDKGVAHARNVGIDLATGKYIAYLDSDDIVYHDWLETMNRHIDTHPQKVLFMPNKNFRVVEVDKNNKLRNVFIEEILFEEFLFSEETIRNLQIQCDTNGMIHKKAAIKRVGLWNQTLKLYEDFEFLLRFVEKFPDKLHFVPQVLVLYTRAYGKDSLCSKANYRVLIESLEKVWKLHGHKKLLADTTWYETLTEKYKKYAKREKLEGITILDHIRKKYGG